jgi:general secretion pathway protein M
MNRFAASAVRLRPLLAALGYVAAVVLLLILAVTSVTGIFEQRAAVAAASDLLVQLDGRRPGAPGAGPGVAAGPIPTGSPFLEGQTLTVAGAALLQRVADAVTKVGGSVLSSQVDVQGVQARNGYVSVLASCEVEQAAIQRLLYDLEAGMPYLFVEQFVAQAPQASQQQPGGTGRMRLLLAVAGRWQGSQ